MSASTSSTNPTLKRVFVWSLPRNLGTAFVKCMSYVDGIQILNEPLVGVFHFGPEGVVPNEDVAKFINSATDMNMEFQNAFDDVTCTYAWAKQQYEADYPGKKILFVRDHAYCLNARYDLIPPGFRHAFLIRHPYRNLPSWKRLLTTKLQLDYDAVSFADLIAPYKQPSGYEMQFNLFKYIKENMDPNAVIFDADDLQNNPASILSQFCQAVEIPYTDKLLEWPEERQIMKTWKASRLLLQRNSLENAGGFFETALKSTQFIPPKAMPKRSDLPLDLQAIADNSMPFYKQMYEMRLKP